MALLAEATGDPTGIGGVSAAGWAAALTQAGVLGWLLLKYIPAKDDERNKISAEHAASLQQVHKDCEARLAEKDARTDALVKGLVEEFAADLERQRLNYKETAADQRKQDREQVQALVRALQVQFTALGQKLDVIGTVAPGDSGVIDGGKQSP